jgi:hypothetical protein
VKRTLFLNEEELSNNEKLTKFVKKPPYFNCQAAIKEIAERKERRRKLQEQEESERSKADSGAELDKSDDQHWDSSKSKKKKSQSSWEDY